MALTLFLALVASAGSAGLPNSTDQTSLPISPENPVRVGLFAIGLNTYWGQFAGLRERLEGYLKNIEKGLTSTGGCEVVSAGLVDTVDGARKAALMFKAQNVRIIFLYVSTYALSSTVLPVVQEAKVPVVVLNLQPAAAIDYKWFNSFGDRGKMTAEWLAFCQACAVPEISNVFNRAGLDFHLVTGTLDDREAWQEISEWVEAARVAEVLRQTNLGILGHYYNGMLDVYSDPTQLAASLGLHLEFLEMAELKELRKKVTAKEIEAKIQEMQRAFNLMPECSRAEIERAARTACALDRLVVEKKLGAMAYYYEGTPGSEEEDLITSMIAGNSLLTARHVPMAGECEVKNAVAMKIMDAFGAGGSFTEFYAMDFKEGVVLMGHDGPGHVGLAEGRPLLKPLGVFHGKPGKGLSIEMRVKPGPVTLLSVVQPKDGQLKLLVAEGESVPGPILEIGNTNSRYKFPLGVKGFVEAWSKEGPAHHCAVGTGHIASKIQKLAAILKLKFVRVY
ncbi:MAG: arabinose isomerase [Candidatus Saccharicenans sp.]|uniref:arabinose isomerase n=1 Tax=Candidatus Saccharicenans sp. TaxID=2819258 RepID=UPI00404A7188